jgi:hypothetical protein
MIALSVALSWMAFTTIAFMALSAAAVARTHGDLEHEPGIAREPQRSEIRTDLLPALDGRRPCSPSRTWIHGGARPLRSLGHGATRPSLLASRSVLMEGEADRLTNVRPLNPIRLP